MAKFSGGPLRRLSVRRNLPTAIRRRPVSGQLALAFRPRERLARRRRRARLRLAFIVFLSIAGLGWGAGFLSYNDRLTIQDIQISGTSALSTRVVQAAFEANLYDGAYHFLSRENIFLYPKGTLAAELKEELPRLKSVSISRESLLAQAVKVTVEERGAQYVWCNSESCYVMDSDGFIFAPVDNATTEYTFRGGLAGNSSPVGQTFLRGRLNNIVELFKRLDEAGYKATGATVENEKDYRVLLGKGFSLKVTFDSEPHEVVRNLELILDSDAIKDDLEKLDYVDLRFGNRVYYQLR
ncbi:MAG: Uncharacterized protein G01um10148_506 [Parcubacteria group bacterium Gr01-1014_8]|nr:MAG: Uncharacterized protein G01um10148_506 [Parcubacteria group bacterium Gr01-1014_8]